MGLFCFILLCCGIQAVLGQPPENSFSPRSVCSNVHPLMTTSNGAPVDDKTSTMTAGPRGPVVIQDFVLQEELAHFNRERIPERVVHAKGAGAYGVFTVKDNTNITKYCKASIFKEVNKQTKLFVRFSTNSLESGSCDTVRDLRGGAFKFYTDDGNWDLVGLNTFIFWIRDPILFPSLNHALKRNPATHLMDPNSFWDFMALRPETMHNLIHFFSDKGTPDGYRFTDYYGVHTFKTVNDKGEAFYVKFHILTDAPEARNLTSDKAASLCATDPDYSTRDLYNSLEKKEFPSWTLNFQVMTPEHAAKLDWDPFDLTKLWEERFYPFYEVGSVVLNQNTDNYFATVEQAAFSPSHLVPGIEPSPDRMLHARLFAYPDAQRYRLGVNNYQLPVNQPHVVVQNNQRDGFMSYYNQGGEVNYYPNSANHSAQPCPAAAQAKWAVTGDVRRYDTAEEDNYSQATLKYTKFDSLQQEAFVNNVVESLKLARVDLQEKMIFHFKKVDETLGTLISKGVGLSTPT